MDIIIKPCEGINGDIYVPPSKSFSQRAIASSILIPSLEIKNLGKSADELAALEIIKILGAKIEWKSDSHLLVNSNFDFHREIILNCGESGLCARLFSGLMLLNAGKTTFIGQGSLLQRPMNSIYTIYEQLGIDYQSNLDFLPLSIVGSRCAIDLEMEGSVSSQFVTGILFYLVGLRHHEVLNLKISNLSSRPYVDMTVETLKSLGAHIEWQDGDELQVIPSKLKLNSTIIVEGDWSSAAFWIGAAAIDGKISLKGLNPHSQQADSIILKIIKDYGAETIRENDVLCIQSKHHKPIEVDLSDAPDLAPIVAVLAIFAEGESLIKGVKRLKHKESDRLQGILNWLEMLNIQYNLREDHLTIVGKSKIKLRREIAINIEFETYQDHRMVMASSILALFLNGGRVKGYTAVHKSYPDFFQDLKYAGGRFFYSN